MAPRRNSAEPIHSSAPRPRSTVRGRLRRSLRRGGFSPRASPCWAIIYVLGRLHAAERNDGPGVSLWSYQLFSQLSSATSNKPRPSRPLRGVQHRPRGHDGGLSVAARMAPGRASPAPNRNDDEHAPSRSPRTTFTSGLPCQGPHDELKDLGDTIDVIAGRGLRPLSVPSGILSPTPPTNCAPRSRCRGRHSRWPSPIRAHPRRPPIGVRGGHRYRTSAGADHRGAAHPGPEPAGPGAQRAGRPRGHRHRGRSRSRGGCRLPGPAPRRLDRARDRVR